MFIHIRVYNMKISILKTNEDILTSRFLIKLTLFRSLSYLHKKGLQLLS